MWHPQVAPPERKLPPVEPVHSKALEEQAREWAQAPERKLPPERVPERAVPKAREWASLSC
jgi:hypothetical protein